jgi:hypothetical protein
MTRRRLDRGVAAARLSEGSLEAELGVGLNDLGKAPLREG